MAVEIQIGFRCIGVATAVVALQHAERDKRIEEISRAAFGDANLGSELFTVEWSLGESGKDSEFGRAQQRFGAPERMAER